MRGDMSIIGPRPERPQFVEQLSKKVSYYTLRPLREAGFGRMGAVALPVRSRARKTPRKKLTFDLFYVKNHNFRFDLMIFIQTVEVVLFARGAR